MHGDLSPSLSHHTKPLTMYRIMCCVVFLLLNISMSTLTVAEEQNTVQLSLQRLTTPVQNPQDILQQHASLQWQSLEQFNFRIQTSDSWLKITFLNDSDQQATRFLEIASKLESIDIYHWRVKNDTITLTPYYRTLGYAHPFAPRLINYRNPIYPITLNAQEERSFLIHLHTPHIQEIHLLLWDSASMQYAKSHELIFFGLIYGALLMIIIFNAFMFYSNQNKKHLLLMLYAGINLLFIGMYEDHIFQFIAPSVPWPKGIVYAIVLAMMCLIFSFFSVITLDLEKRAPALSRSLIGISGAAALLILALAVRHPLESFSPFCLLIVIGIYSANLATSLWVWNQRGDNAGWLSLATAVLTLGLLLDFLAKRR